MLNKIVFLTLSRKNKGVGCLYIIYYRWWRFAILRHIYQRVWLNHHVVDVDADDDEWWMMMDDDDDDDDIFKRGRTHGEFHPNPSNPQTKVNGETPVNKIWRSKPNQRPSSTAERIRLLTRCFLCMLSPGRILRSNASFTSVLFTLFCLLFARLPLPGTKFARLVWSLATN